MIEAFKRGTSAGWHRFGMAVGALALAVYGVSLALKIYLYFSSGAEAQAVDHGALLIAVIQTVFIPPVIYMFFWLCGRIARKRDGTS